ncbi:MAG TPA: hypothetical protein VGK19_02125 [Capsulimonadaceae bacterium]|jgi:DNA topoisomerase-1
MKHRSEKTASRDTADPTAVAKSAGLRYVSDNRPGLRRIRAAKGLRYVGLDGRPVTDPETIKRIKSLGIPPAYCNVWICQYPNGHLQATGRDARGRKQYRYHPKWREIRDSSKYGRVIEFGRALPLIREHTATDLARKGMPREKLLATVVRLLETTLIRVGNDEYARQNNSFGLTTMRNKHVRVNGSSVTFKFRGKSGKDHEIDLKDRRLARIVRACQELPGQSLFEYTDDDGVIRTIDSGDVNDYLRDITGQEFTAKDFRTWAGTVLAALALRECEKFETEAEAKQNITRAIERVSARLGNTPAICRKCYVHPAVIEAYMSGTLSDAMQRLVGDVEGK